MFAELLPGLTHGRWEATTGMFITPDRQQVARFTRPIWSLRDGILIPIASRTRVDGYQSLAATGAQLAVLRGQVQASNALVNGFTARDLVVYEDYPQAAAAVGHGEVAGYAGYASVALAHREHLAAHPNAVFTVVTVPDREVAPSPGAFACVSPLLRDRLDLALAHLLGPTAPVEPSADPATWPKP